MNRKQLREYVARKLFHMFESTATGGSTGTVLDTALARYANDYWNGAQVYISDTTDDAAPIGETAWVSDFAVAAGSGTLTLHAAMTAAVEAGDTYQVYVLATKSEIDAALARAARGAIIQTSLTPSTTQVDYYLTSAVGLSRASQVVALWFRPLGDVTCPPYRLRDWVIEDAEGQLTLRLPDTLSSTDQLWLEYYADENYLTTDARSVNLPERLVLARAAVELIEMVMSRQGPSGSELWGSRLRYWQEVEMLESRKAPRLPRQTVVQQYGETDRASIVQEMRDETSLSETEADPLWGHVAR